MCQNVSRLQIFQNKPSKTNKVTDVLVPRVPDTVSSYGMNFYNMQHIQIHKTKGTLVHEREWLTLLKVCFEYRF